MTRVLLTAFEPYDRWKSNASWLALIELTRDLSTDPQVITRLYPVDYSTVKQRLRDDLAAGVDVAIHLGQAPGSGRIQLEAIGLNVGGSSQQLEDELRMLVDDGPVAYRSALPLATWARKLREAGIPAQVSYSAGTYLCNATLYYSCHLAQSQGLNTRSAFIHLPLAPSQVLGDRHDLASLPTERVVAALRLILEELRQPRPEARLASR